jgi:hypothetical protein
MAYIRTELATDWPESRGLLDQLSSALDVNPDYRDKLHEVRSWLIEFDEEGLPWREIGLGADGGVVLAGPSERNYGYWLDSNMTLSDFPGEPISRELFEDLWRESGVQEP